jgi:hypothetical protein
MANEKIVKYLGIAVGGWLFYLIITGIIGLIVFLVVFFTVVYPNMKSASNKIQQAQDDLYMQAQRQQVNPPPLYR